MTRPDRHDVPETMKAMALDQFGGPENMRIQTLPVPEVGKGEVLIHVESIGVGVWDPAERSGVFAQRSDRQPDFPYVMGFDGAGTVVATGDDVSDPAVGDRVYATRLLNPKGGFYAHYVVVDAGHVSEIPDGLDVEQAGAMPMDGVTALRGLEDALKLEDGETLLIVGAAGGVGHLAIQLAKRMGAEVLAVASGRDGVQLAARLGADGTLDGRAGDIRPAVKAFAPGGVDAALLTTGGDVATHAIDVIREGGRAAFPNGVRPEPESRGGIEPIGYDGLPDPESIRRLNRLIATETEMPPFQVHVARTFPLERAAEAHEALQDHYLGKLALTTH